MDELKRRSILSEVALGNVPADSVILNATLFNVFTGEFLPKQAVWIKEGMIAYAGPDHDPPRDKNTALIEAEGMVLLPGLIDGHTHINRMGIEEFTKGVIPGGVTTVVMETMEFGMVAGKRGVGLFASALRRQPVRIYYTVSPVCGLTPSMEINAISGEEILPFLGDSRCLGLGEIYWGNIFLPGRQGERVKELASLTLDLGKRVEGHTAGAPEKKLQAYACLGASSCHEPITEDEVMDRLRLGYWVMVREGAIRKELERIKGVFNRGVDLRRMVLVTDGVDPESFIGDGGLDAALRTALKLGVPAPVAYQMVTLNAAEHFRLDHLIGSLSPGKMADLVLVPKPDAFSPQLVMCDGKIIFRDGKTLVEPERAVLPDDLFDTVHISEQHLPRLPERGKARAIELVTRLVTREKLIDLQIPEESTDVVMILASERLGRNKSFMGLLKGLGLRRGAYGSTMTWDTLDMVVVGCDLESMRTAIERLKEIRGGGVYAVGREVVAEISTPLCGSLSLRPVRTLYEEMAQLEAALRENGVAWEKPALTIDTLTTPAIPHMRISHEGYVRLKDRQVLPVEV